MRFFSGFGFQNESELFSFDLKNTIYSVAGFSLGAIRACEYALQTPKRIDSLTLISPAFFQDQPASFRQKQLKTYNQNTSIYLRSFYRQCLKPGKLLDIEKYKSQTTKENLEFLLNYQWQSSDLEQLKNRGINITVHLGEHDAIIDSKATRDFFQPYAEIWWHRKAGHLLLEATDL